MSTHTEGKAPTRMWVQWDGVKLPKLALPADIVAGDVTIGARIVGKRTVDIGGGEIWNVTAKGCIVGIEWS